VHDAYASHPLITTAFAPHSTAALSDESFLALRVLADQLDVPVQIHLHESAAEVADALRATGKRPLQRIDELGLVNASLLVVHGVHLADAEIERLAEAGAALVHCPTSNLKLASGIAPLACCRAAGIAVGLGTDGAASNNTLDVLQEMRTATLLAKAVSGDAAELPASQALEMATLGGATVLGLAGEIGSIEAGKLADLACIDLGPVNSRPVYDPVSQVVYTARADQVTDVWVAGRHRLDNGRLAGFDCDALLARCDEWRRRIGSTARGERRRIMQ